MLGHEVAECLFIFEIPRLREVVREKMGVTPVYAVVALTEETLAKFRDSEDIELRWSRVV
jgi:hypothetical protein